jgi:hypothetical protein
MMMAVETVTIGEFNLSAMRTKAVATMSCAMKGVYRAGSIHFISRYDHGTVADNA